MVSIGAPASEIMLLAVAVLLLSSAGATSTPSAAPTARPSAVPSAAPTDAPTTSPSKVPSAAPTSSPSALPTFAPTSSPTTRAVMIALYAPLNVQSSTADDTMRRRQEAVASLLGARHLSRLDSVVVPELQSPLMRSCPLEFSFMVNDTQGQIATALNLLLDDTTGMVPLILAGDEGEVVMPLAQVAAGNDVAVLSYGARQTELNELSVYGTFGRTVPSASSVSLAVASLWNKLLVTSMAIVYESSPYGRGIRDSLLQYLCEAPEWSCPSNNPLEFEYPIDIRYDESAWARTLQKLNQDSPQAVLVALSDTRYGRSLARGFALSATGEDKFRPDVPWIFTDVLNEEFLEFLSQANPVEANFFKEALAIRVAPGQQNSAPWTNLRSLWSGFAARTTSQPTGSPSFSPSATPSFEPTSSPSNAPSYSPTQSPVDATGWWNVTLGNRWPAISRDPCDGSELGASNARKTVVNCQSLCTDPCKGFNYNKQQERCWSRICALADQPNYPLESYANVDYYERLAMTSAPTYVPNVAPTSSPSIIQSPSASPSTPPREGPRTQSPTSLPPSGTATPTADIAYAHYEDDLEWLVSVLGSDAAGILTPALFDTPLAASASFAYDASIAAGIASCMAWRQDPASAQQNMGIATYNNGLRNSLHFNGTSGSVALLDTPSTITATRDPRSVSYGLYAVNGASLREIGTSGGDHWRDFGRVSSQIKRNGQTIKVPMMLWITNPSSSNGLFYGQDVNAAALLAAKHFNERDTSVLSLLDMSSPYLDGCQMKLQVHVHDTEGHGPTAMGGLLSLAFTPDAVVGAVRSSVSMPLALVNGQQGIPQISFWSTSTELSNRDDYPSFTRMIPSDEAGARVIAQLLHTWDYDFANLLYPNNAYGMSLQIEMTTKCRQLGIFLSTAAYEPETSFTSESAEETSSKVQASIASALSRLDSRVRVNVVVMGDVALPLFIAAATAANIMGTHSGKSRLWIFNENTSPQSFANLDAVSAEAISGSVLVKNVGGTTRNSGWANLTAAWRSVPEDISSFVNRYLEQYNASFDFAEFGGNATVATYLNPVAAFAYDAVIAIGVAACSNSVPPHEASADDAEDGEGKGEGKGGGKGEGYTSGGPDTDRASTTGLVGDALVDITFEGTSGMVEFDNTTGSRLPETTTFLLDNIVSAAALESASGQGRRLSSGAVVREAVGRWGRRGWVFDEPILFAGGYGDAHRPEPPGLDVPSEDLNHLTGKGAGITFLALCWGAVLVFGCWTVVNRNTKVIKHSQFEFLLVILVGVTISSSAIIFLSVDDSTFPGDYFNDTHQTLLNTSCMSAVWLYVTGFLLTFLALFAKVFRVMRIFNNKKLRKIKPLKSRTLISYIVACILANAGLLLTIQLTNPLVWVRTVESVDPVTNLVTASNARCTMRDGRKDSTTVLVIIELSIIFGMMFGGAYLCFLSRNADTAYFERQSITASIASIVQIFAIGVPMVLATRSDPDAQYFVLVGIIFINNFALLVFLYIPKIWAWRKDSKAAAKESTLSSGSTESHSHSYNPTAASRPYRARGGSSSAATKPHQEIELATLKGTAPASLVLKDTGSPRNRDESEEDLKNFHDASSDVEQSSIDLASVTPELPASTALTPH